MYLRYASVLACLAMTSSVSAVEGGEQTMSGRVLPLGSVETLTISSDQPGAYDFTADVAGRARAVHVLVQAGATLADARKLAGWTE